jgi:hypothetical protein
MRVVDERLGVEARLDVPWPPWRRPVPPATGKLTISPGTTNTPAGEALQFLATGPLDGGGGCTGRMTFEGVLTTGSSCFSQIFEGKVRAVPGVARFWGPGAFGVLDELLYDRAGQVVGSDQPQSRRRVRWGQSVRALSALRADQSPLAGLLVAVGRLPVRTSAPPGSCNTVIASVASCASVSSLARRHMSR